MVEKVLSGCLETETELKCGRKGLERLSRNLTGAHMRSKRSRAGVSKPKRSSYVVEKVLSGCLETKTELTCGRKGFERASRNRNGAHMRSKRSRAGVSKPKRSSYVAERVLSGCLETETELKCGRKGLERPSRNQNGSENCCKNIMQLFMKKPTGKIRMDATML